MRVREREGLRLLFLLASNCAPGLKCRAKTPGFTLHFLPTLHFDWLRGEGKLPQGGEGVNLH